MSQLISIYKAQRLVDSAEEVPGVQISIDQEIPRQSSLDQQRATYRDQARLLADALRTVLPGGTFDRLVAELLAAKASDFIVPHDRIFQAAASPPRGGDSGAEVSTKRASDGASPSPESPATRTHGVVTRADPPPGSVCLRCGHEPCSACRIWCDQIIPDSTILCCDGQCIYPGDPGAEGVQRTDWPTREPRDDAGSGTPAEGT